MTRDRLGELQMKTQKRKENDKVAVDGSSTANGVPNSASDGKSYKNVKETFKRAEVLREWIETIEENVAQIRQYLRKVEDIKYNQKDVREKLDSLFQQNTKVSHQITGKLKEFQAVLHYEDESAQGRIERVQCNSLKTRFQEAFRNHMTELENYKNIQKDILKAHLRAKGEVNVTDEELSALIDDGKEVQVFTENIISETAEARRMLADIEERHDQLLKIEHMLVEVRDLFVQMAILIDTQGEVIDRIEHQARNARDHVRLGNENLGDAGNKKKKYLKRKIYCSVIIVVIIVIIIAAFLIPRN